LAFKKDKFNWNQGRLQQAPLQETWPVVTGKNRHYRLISVAICAKNFHPRPYWPCTILSKLQWISVCLCTFYLRTVPLPTDGLCVCTGIPYRLVVLPTTSLVVGKNKSHNYFYKMTPFLKKGETLFFFLEQLFIVLALYYIFLHHIN